MELSRRGWWGRLEQPLQLELFLSFLFLFLFLLVIVRASKKVSHDIVFFLAKKVIHGGAQFGSASLLGFGFLAGFGRLGVSGMRAVAGWCGFLFGWWWYQSYAFLSKNGILLGRFVLVLLVLLVLLFVAKDQNASLGSSSRFFLGAVCSCRRRRGIRFLLGLVCLFRIAFFSEAWCGRSFVSLWDVVRYSFQFGSIQRVIGFMLVRLGVLVVGLGVVFLVLVVCFCRGFLRILERRVRLAGWYSFDTANHRQTIVVFIVIILIGCGCIVLGRLVVVVGLSRHVMVPSYYYGVAPPSSGSRYPKDRRTRHTPLRILLLFSAKGMRCKNGRNVASVLANT